MWSSGCRTRSSKQGAGGARPPARKWRLHSDVSWSLLSCTLNRGLGLLLIGILRGLLHRLTRIVFTLLAYALRHGQPWPPLFLVWCWLFCRSPRRARASWQNQARSLARELPGPPSGLPQPTHQSAPLFRGQAAAGRPESSARCSIGRLVGGVSGAASVTPLSRQDGSHWGRASFGALLGSQVGCNAGQGRDPALVRPNGAPGSRKRCFPTR